MSLVDIQLCFVQYDIDTLIYLDNSLCIYINGIMKDKRACFAEDISYLTYAALTLGYNANFDRYFKGQIRGLKLLNYAVSEVTVN